MWGDEDLGAVLRHQWAAPLAADLGGLEETSASRTTVLASSRSLVLGSFGNLLTHTQPPVELLALVKDFAKRCLSSPLSTVPHDVARVLYFASIASALIRCDQRITVLSDGELAAGMRWCLAQDWLNDDARDVLAAGLGAVKQSVSAEDE